MNKHTGYTLIEALVVLAAVAVGIVAIAWIGTLMTLAWSAIGWLQR